MNLFILKLKYKILFYAGVFCEFCGYCKKCGSKLNVMPNGRKFCNNINCKN